MSGADRGSAIGKIYSVIMNADSVSLNDVLDNWSVSEEEIATRRRYYCGIEGCTKSYSSRQNCYRHRCNDHKMKPKPSANQHSELEVYLSRERAILMETFSSICDQSGEADAANVMRSCTRLKDHLVPLRKALETEIAKQMEDALASHSTVAMLLNDFKNTIPSDSHDEAVALNAVLKLAENATPDSIGRLQQFVKLSSALVADMAEHSEILNPKLKQARSFKALLDDLFAEEVESLKLPSPRTLRKRSASALEAADGTVHPGGLGLTNLPLASRSYRGGVSGVFSYSSASTASSEQEEEDVQVESTLQYFL